MEAFKRGRRWTTSVCSCMSGNVHEVHLILKQNGYVVEEIEVFNGVSSLVFDGELVRRGG